MNAFFVFAKPLTNLTVRDVMDSDERAKILSKHGNFSVGKFYRKEYRATLHNAKGVLIASGRSRLKWIAIDSAYWQFKALMLINCGFVDDTQVDLEG